MPATTWMPLYTSDFISSTLEMTQAQMGAYIRLLCYAWDNGGLPNDMEACGRIAGGMTPSDWKVIRRRLVVLDEGTSEERLSHQRLEEERVKCEAKYDAKCRAAAKAREGRSVPNVVPNPVPNVVSNVVSNVDNSPQPEPEPELEPELQRQNDSATQNLRATRKARRTYRIAWDSDAGFQGITDADRTAWSQAYPGVSLEGELAKAHVYLRENPAKAGKRNWGAFLARWFARVQDKGGSPQAPSKAPSGWSTKKYFRAKFQAHMTDAEYEAALRGLGARQTAAQPSGGVSTFSDVIARYSASQEPQNGNYPD